MNSANIYLNTLMLVLLKDPELNDFQAAAIYLRAVSDIDNGVLNITGFNFEDLYYRVLDRVEQGKRNITGMRSDEKEKAWENTRPASDQNADAPQS